VTLGVVIICKCLLVVGSRCVETREVDRVFLLEKRIYSCLTR
jgi:hypothetical protein